MIMCLRFVLLNVKIKSKDLFDTIRFQLICSDTDLISMRQLLISWGLGSLFLRTIHEQVSLFCVPFFSFFLIPIGAIACRIRSVCVQRSRVYSSAVTGNMKNEGLAMLQAPYGTWNREWTNQAAFPYRNRTNILNLWNCYFLAKT